jgi:hypothetical protein
MGTITESLLRTYKLSKYLRCIQVRVLIEAYNMLAISFIGKTGLDLLIN